LGEQNSLEQASECVEHGQLAESILHYEAALQNEPNNPEIW
jgi:hypothetical protein